MNQEKQMNQHDYENLQELQNLPNMLTVNELAALLRVNRKTIYEAISKNNIPGVVRIGRNLRISKQIVLKWINSQGCVSSMEK